MSKRLRQHVTRPAEVSILVNGELVKAYDGESLATALIAAGTLVMSRDPSGRPKSPFCNMGVCFDCMVAIEEPGTDGAVRSSRLRACMTPVREGLRVRVPREE
ncbi:MAG TPA: (2Fe-2S)-binding protein [Steroidobacter sp.]|jgi:sarcosine oxidase subunit alpha